MPSSRARRAAARKAATDRRRRVAAGAVAFVVLGGGAVLASTLRSSDRTDRDVAPRPQELEGGSEELDRSGLIEIRDEPAVYRLAYRVETYGGGRKAVVTRDEITVRRPFDARTTKRSGPDDDDEVRSEQVAALGRLFVPEAPNAQQALLETGPSLAPSDVRVAPVLGDLIASGRVDPREWRRVGGRPCQVLRFGGPISSGTVAPALDPSVEYADACVSEEGLVLEEVWVDRGRVQRRRLATSLDVGTDAVPSSALDVGEAAGDPVPVDEGGGSFRPVAPDSAYAAPFWVLDEPPLGEHLGRWAVVAPAGNDPKEEETKERRLGFVADVWRAGIDVVVVEQGSTAGGVAPFQLGDGAKVTVEGLGEGEVVLDLRTTELRFRRPGGYFLRVRGTIGAAGLEEIARRLRETPGGSGLQYTDGE